MRGGQRAHVGALSVIFPCDVDGDGAVGHKLHVGLGAVNAVKAAAIDAQGNADAVLHLAIGLGVLLGNALLRGLVQRAGGLEKILLAVHVGGVAGRNGRMLGRLVAVALTHVEGVDAHLGGQAVDSYFGAHEGLGRAVGTEGGAPCMVGVDRGALVADAGYAVACTGELAETVGQQIAEFGIRAVIHIVVAPQSLQLAAVVSGQLDMHVGGGALAGVGDVLILGEHQGNRSLGDKSRHTQKCLVGGRELVAEGAAGVVLYHAQLLHWNADAVGDHWHMQMDADGLGVDGEHAVLVRIGIAAVRLQMQMGLA